MSGSGLEMSGSGLEMSGSGREMSGSGQEMSGSGREMSGSGWDLSGCVGMHRVRGPKKCLSKSFVKIKPMKFMVVEKIFCDYCSSGKNLGRLLANFK